jgi:hypothetical protein
MVPLSLLKVELDPFPDAILDFPRHPAESGWRSRKYENEGSKRGWMGVEEVESERKQEGGGAAPKWQDRLTAAGHNTLVDTFVEPSWIYMGIFSSADYGGREPVALEEGHDGVDVVFCLPALRASG